MALARSLAGSLVKPLAAAITGGGADLAADVRALFTANGGDFTGTMLDFGKTDALWQDTGATTPAGDGDTLGRVDDQSGEGNNATQSSASSRPTLTTDPFGTLVAQPDGTDDYMDLPQAALGDGTQHIHAFVTVSPDTANSDSSAILIRVTSSLALFLSSGNVSVFQSDGGSISTKTDPAYARAVTDNETLLVEAVYDPSNTRASINVNGVEVAADESAYSSQDSGAGIIFGADVSQSLAGTCHGITTLIGSRVLTASEVTAVRAYHADLASDTLLTADADTVLSRVFRPATDLNVTDDFTDDIDGWTSPSGGASGISHDATGGRLQFTRVSPDNSVARATFPVRVGYRYTITLDNDAASAGAMNFAAGVSAGDTSLGTDSSVAAGNTASISFTATQPVLHVQAWRTTDGTHYADNFTLTEIAATGDYWDLLDPTKRFTDAGSTQAGANDDVQQINSVEGDYPFTQTTSADRATLDGTATNLVFDGSTDFYVATDATDDLVQTGDTTELWAVTPDVSASARVISSAGDSTVATDTASVFSINGSDQLSLQQADASNTETETTAITVTEGAVNVISFVRDGASVVFGIGADEVETETFATVTTPTAGTSPAFNLGISVDQSSGPYDGSIQAGLKLNRALSTGLTVHAIRALQEKTA